MINTKTYMLIFSQGALYGVGMALLIMDHRSGYVLFILAVAISFILRRWLNKNKHIEVEQFHSELLSQFHKHEYDMTGTEFNDIIARAKQQLYKDLKS